MSSFIVLNLIIIGVYLMLTLVYTFLLRSISFKPAFLLFFDRYFDIRAVPKEEESNNLVLDVYGTEVTVSDSRRFRLSLHVLGVSCLYIITVVFFDGCILTTSIMPPTEPCPSDPNTICFLFRAMTESPWTEFDCPSGLPAISSNITASTVICYTWMIKSQGIITVLNQLGICCSILSLLGFIFRFFYRLAFRARWGRLLTIFLAAFLIIISAIFTFVVPIAISYITLVLSMAAGCLLIDALYLSRLVHQLKKPSSNSVRIEKPVTSN